MNERYFSDSLAALVETYGKWLFLPDLDPLLCVLAIVAGNRLPGDPIWLFLVGPPSCGKTELLSPLRDAVGEVRFVEDFSKAALLTATPGGRVGGLLPSFDEHDRFGSYGILVIKDFALMITSGGADALEERFSVLRAVFDGFYDRRLGHQGGMSLAWSGKAGLVAAVTDEIDQHQGRMSALGHRYIYCRHVPAERDDLAEMQRRASANIGRQDVMRRSLGDAVGEFFDGLALPEQPEAVPDPERLHALARLTTRARSHVGHDLTGKVIYINQPEYPMRLGAELGQLYAGLRAIGVRDEEEAFRIVARVAFDSIPPVRSGALRYLVECNGRPTTEEVSSATQAVPALCAEALGDLAAHGLAEQGPDLRWAPSELALLEWNAASGPVAEVGAA